jgi:EAL domain-containing protein (putative c-di-GMP-specific phosphodiesterase class I)
MEEGDRLLQRIGWALQTQMPEGSVCGRLGCDRFCVQSCESDSQKVIDFILQEKFYAGNPKTGNFQVHIDIGVFKIADPGMEVSVMCDRARLALDTIKDNRLTRVAYYEDRMYDQLLMEQELSADLPTALERGQIKVYVQPQVDAEGQLLGAETLLRWQHPTRGLLMPGDFLHFFEKNYMIVEIDRYMWEMSCAALRNWLDHGISNLYLAINISPIDLESMDVCQVLGDLVKKYKIPQGMLRVEITETTMMQNPSQQIKLVGKLRTAGFYVEMDDFGSGYSSFSMLKDMYMDALKLDMKFLSSRNQERGDTILMAMVKLVKNLRMTVVAEGVETKEQVEYLRSIGCDIFQGFYFSEPIPIEDFEEDYLNIKVAKIS